MKNLLSLVLVFASLNAFSQELFTLEHTLDGLFNFNGDNFIMQTTPAEKNVFYTSEVSGNSFIYKIYDTEYRLTTKKYTFNIPDNCILSGITQLSIPGDTDVYFIITMLDASKTMGESGYCRTIVFDKDGNQYFELKKSSSNSFVSPIMYLIDNKYKLIVNRYEYTTSGTSIFTDIYCINKETDNTAVYTATNRAIPLTQVFNTNGVLLEETDEDISTRNFSKGIYIIRQNNQTKKIILGE